MEFSADWKTFKARPKESGKVLESLTMKVPGLWLFNKLIASSLVMCGLYHHLWFSFTWLNTDNCHYKETEIKKCSKSKDQCREKEKEN